MKDKSGENSKSTDAHSDSSNRGESLINRAAYKFQKLRLCRTEVPSVDKNVQQDGGVAGDDKKIDRKGVYGNKLDGDLHSVGIKIDNGLYNNLAHLSHLKELKGIRSKINQHLDNPGHLELFQYFENKFKGKDQTLIKGTQITLSEYRNAINKVSVDAQLADQHPRKRITRGDEKKMTQQFDKNYKELLAVEDTLKAAKRTIEASERKKYLETIQEQFPKLEKESYEHINKIDEFLVHYENEEIIEEKLENEYKELRKICGDAESQIKKVQGLLDKNGQDRSDLPLELGRLVSFIQTLQEAAGKLPDFQEKVDKSIIVAEDRVSPSHGGESSSSQGRS